MGGSDHPVVCVFGSSDPEVGTEAYETARAVGATLAQLGYVVANGGYGGTMAASARGAKDARGTTIGVTCEIWDAPVNEYIDRRISTSSLAQRLDTLISLGTGGYVILPGATGTLQELATVWERMGKGAIPRTAVVCVGGFWQSLLGLMELAKPSCAAIIRTITGPEQLADCFPAAGKFG